MAGILCTKCMVKYDLKKLTFKVRVDIADIYDREGLEIETVCPTCNVRITFLIDEDELDGFCTQAPFGTQTPT